MGTAATLVFLAVVGGRFVIPLFIPRYPLPAIVAALVLDGIDQTIFQLFGFDPPGYQSYDKAMDVFYLAIAYLSTMRNWTSRPAISVARFLFFYRLAGVVLFELTQERFLLLIFPNTFEYFFIAYEIIRMRRDPARYRKQWWWIVAAAIWIFVKLPQEWWIHVAQLDVTDTLRKYPGLGVAVAVAATGLALAAWLLLRHRLPPPDWPWRVRADPLPEEIRTTAQRDAWVAVHGRLLSLDTAEKVFLVGLVSVIYGQVLPGLRVTSAELFLGVAAFVVVNAAISLWAARGSRSTNSMAAAFGIRVLVNVVLVLTAGAILGRDLRLAPTFFFMGLLSLITLLDDRFRPVSEVRFAQASAPYSANGERRGDPPVSGQVVAG